MCHSTEISQLDEISVLIFEDMPRFCRFERKCNSVLKI